jgi:hypothetical protein
MKPLVVLVGCLLLAGAAQAEKPVMSAVPLPDRVSCNLGPVAYDWNFAVSDWGFTPVPCDTEGASPVWEYGTSTIIPGGPGPFWGTILNGPYPSNSGQGLRSPTWTVNAQSCLLEVWHLFETEPTYDGCNLTVLGGSYLWDPEGGYTVAQISPSGWYYAYCVDNEPGWTGSSGGWRVDCFDLSEFMGMAIDVQFDFGSDSSVEGPGWYIARARVGGPAPSEAVCCDLSTGGCFLSSASACAEFGGEWHWDWTSCDPNPCPPPAAYEPVFRIGSWLHAEPWHAWAAPDSIPLQLVVDRPPSDPIVFVEFFWDSLGNWRPLGADTDGSEPWFDTQGYAAPAGNGWSLLAALPDPIPQPTIIFKAIANTASRAELEFQLPCEIDPAPPSMGKVMIQDFSTSDDDTLGLSLNPNGVDIDFIAIWARQMEDVYEKGVPGISQQAHSTTHCAPTATAQCLKYFERAEMDSMITGYLDDNPLVDSLAVYMATNQGPEPGTYVSDWIGGLADWIQQHEGGYTVRPFLHYDEEGWTWSQRDWLRIRNELQRCQDVLLGVFWSRGGGIYSGGHAITLNSIANELQPNGSFGINFEDPWTGHAEYGFLDPATGVITDMTGAGGGGSARIGLTLIVSPRESDFVSGGPGEPFYIGPNPYPEPIPVPLPELGGWFIHVVIVNTQGHAWRVTKAVFRSAQGVEEPAIQPDAFALGPCTPNPFWGTTAIAYALPSSGHVRLEIYDLTGRRVRMLADDAVAAGVHQAHWDGKDDAQQPVAAGIYYARMASGPYRGTARVILLR